MVKSKNKYMSNPTEKINLASTAKTATSFTPQGRAITPDVLRSNFPQAEIHGEPGETGLVVFEKSTSTGRDEMIAAVRHGTWVPLDFDEHGKVRFGGVHTETHIEHLLGREIPGQDVANEVIQAVKQGSMPPYRALTMGVEAEAWHHTQDGNIRPVLIEDQLELQQGLLENPRPVQDTTPNTPKAVMYDRAQHMLERSGPQGKYNTDLVLDTGVPLVGSWYNDGVRINGGEYSQYVHAAATKLEHVLSTSDKYATELANRIAGGDYIKLTHTLGHMGTWVVAAAHVSVGAPHVQMPTGEIAVPLDIAIAQADVYNSELSTVIEMLMAGAPLMMGQPTIVRGEDGKDHWARDGRAVFRHTLETTYAGPFINTPEEYRDRVKRQITTGEANTADRAAYTATVKGKERPVMHGALRVRLAGGLPADPDNTKTWVGRIEYTGRSASPSLLDEAASNAMLYLLTLASYEAVAAGKHPTEHFANMYPSMTRWQNRQDLVRDYSMYGADHPQVGAVITEALRFITDMGSKYPDAEHVQQMVALAKARVNNMLVPAEETPRTLKEYVQKPHGSISVVMQHMYEDGASALDIAKAVHEYQLEMARQFVQHRGDGVSVLGLTESDTRRSS